MKMGIPYKNDKREGYYKLYYNNGKLKEEGFYKNDKLEGIVKQYYEGGELDREMTCKNDKKDGVEKVYRKNGKYFFIMKNKDSKAVSGECHMTNGNIVPLTNAE